MKDKKKKSKRKNPWLDHVKDFREKNPDMKFTEVLREAKKTYKK